MNTATIGAAVEYRTLGGYHTIRERRTKPVYPVQGLTSWHYLTASDAKSVSSLSGSSQKAEHRFPDVSPVLDEKPTADGEPGASMTVAALPTERYAVRQEDIYYQVRWLLMSDDSPIKRQVVDACDGMQPHDLDDMRQDLCIMHWRRAVAAEYRGIRKYGVGKWLIGDVRRWIGRNIGKSELTANPDPLTAEELRTLSLKSRSATIDKELANEQAASLAALAKAKPPAPVVSFSW